MSAMRLAVDMCTMNSVPFERKGLAGWPLSPPVVGSSSWLVGFLSALSDVQMLKTSRHARGTNDVA